MHESDTLSTLLGAPRDPCVIGAPIVSEGDRVPPAETGPLGAWRLSTCRETRWCAV